MVYVINAQVCNGFGTGLASLRNRLFTAITRSKVWVRVIGYGPQMQGLIDEFSALRRRNFVLDYTYPDATLLRKLRFVPLDLSTQEKNRLDRRKSHLAGLFVELDNGELNLTDFYDA